MFSMLQRRAVALLVLSAVLAFGIQSALEVFHPIEVAPQNLSLHDHIQVGDGASLLDSSHADRRNHKHHYCAHSNALACLGRLETVFQRSHARLPTPKPPLCAPCFRSSIEARPSSDSKFSPLDPDTCVGSISVFAIGGPLET